MREIVALKGDRAWFVGRSHIFSTSKERTWVWNQSDGSLVQEFPKLCRESPDGVYLLTSFDGQLTLFETKSPRKTAIVRGKYFSHFYSGGSRVVTFDDNAATTYVSDVATGREQFSLPGIAASYGLLGGARIVTVVDSESSWLWDALTGRQLAKVRGHLRSFNRADKRFVTMRNDDLAAWLWDEQGREIAEIQPASGDRLTNLEFSSNGQRLLVGSRRGDRSGATTSLRDATTGREIAELKGRADMPKFTLVVTRDDGACYVWEAATGRELDQMRGQSIEYSADGTRVATISHAFTSHIWDAATGREVAALEGAYPVFSPDGKRVVTNFDDESVLWELVA
mgnify:CR=1 FL=1